jgi:hypothetical protein
MAENRIEHEFEVYGEWRERLHISVGAYRDWLAKQDLSDAQTGRRIEEILSTLTDNRLYIAFVAEYSRGKSELINAVFFPGYGQRVLPSSAGRTTMCPTELMYDKEADSCIRLLPIETRKSGTTIAEYKSYPEEWHTIPLDTADADAMAEALQQIVEVKTVPPADAQAMGLHIAKDEAHEDGMHMTDDGQVEIPTWRHAIINFPHPLLEQGLVILDTPGLNALGAEPELTLNLLSSAHAVVFILAADTGVTKSDMAVWRDHISGAEGPNKGTLVVLNKIDTLWDELRDWDEVEREIERQIKDTARTLSIPENRIFPLSAQKALLGKIRQNEDILTQSRIGEFEAALAEAIIPAKRDIVRENVRTDISDVVKATRVMVMQRLNGVQDHISELEGLNSKNIEVIEDMMAKVKGSKEHLEKSLQRFHATRSIFSQQTNLLYTHLNLQNLDSVIAQTKKDMAVSLTTAGLKSCMNKFFTSVRGSLENANEQAQEIKELMEGVYRKFQEEHGLANVRPGSFSVNRYIRELRAIETKHDQLLSGMSLVVTEQMGVIRRFYASVVGKVREIYRRANHDADNWLKAIMSPMESQVREHQVQLRRRLESIKRIHKATDSLDDRLRELQHVRDGLRDQEATMETLLSDLFAALDEEPASGGIQIEETA